MADEDTRPNDDTEPQGEEKPFDQDSDAKPDDDPAKLREELRKHRDTERRAKRAEKRIGELEAERAEAEKANQSEQERAIEAARKEGFDAAKAEFDSERRQDRLEIAVARAATAGVPVGDDAKRMKFRDPDDALAIVSRRIAAGDLDADDLYDPEGKVQTAALEAELGNVLAARTHLAATDNGSPPGDPDTGKGAPASTDLESMGVEDHLAALQGKR